MGRSAMHVAVGNDRAGVTNRDTNGVFRLLQDQQVGLIVANQELERTKKSDVETTTKFDVKFLSRAHSERSIKNITTF